MKDFFFNKTVLVTGSCGSVGSKIVERLLSYKCKSVIGIDNNEGSLFFQKEEYKKYRNFQIKLVDICNLDQTINALSDVDYVIHCAALKNVPICEISPSSCIEVNVKGTSNIIKAARYNKVLKVLFTSSDKAVNPTNIMGASKLVAEKLVTAANLENSSKDITIFSSTRFGNVIGSTGSVLPIFIDQIKKGKKLSITSEHMTRFMMSNKKSVDLVLNSLKISTGGEIFITKMPTINIFIFARCVHSLYSKTKKFEQSYDIVGPRQGEKMYEELMSEEEITRSHELKEYFVVLPSNIETYNKIKSIKKFKKFKKVKKVFNSKYETSFNFKQTLDFLSKILKNK
jgi:FlaA1/EpsC-like NDP-sugar epimerase